MTATPNVVSYWGRGIFAVAFIVAVAIIARILSAYGKRFLNHTFKSDDAIVQPVHILLNLGFYLLCIGLTKALRRLTTWAGRQSNSGTATALSCGGWRSATESRRIRLSSQLCKHLHKHSEGAITSI
jgi:hypothetical protein